MGKKSRQSRARHRQRAIAEKINNSIKSSFLCKPAQPVTAPTKSFPKDIERLTDEILSGDLSDLQKQLSESLKSQE